MADGTECMRCADENCVECFPSDTCRVCNGRVNDDGACVERPNAAVVSNVGAVACDDGSVSKNGECVTPSSLFASCTTATAERCLTCDGGVVGSDGSCLQCTVLATGGCECGRHEFFDGVQCSSCGDHCSICNGGVCMVCDDGYHAIDGQCVLVEDTVADATSDGTVTRCADGFFLEDGACHACDGCATCFNATTCLSCGADQTLSGSTCESGTEVNERCKTPIPNGGGCAICRDGFYREDTTCVACPDSCESCSKSGCHVCTADFWLNATSLLCESYDELSNCTGKAATGCVSCDAGFFVSWQVCAACNTAMAGCTSSDSVRVCAKCEANHVPDSGACVPLASVEDVVEPDGLLLVHLRDTAGR